MVNLFQYFTTYLNGGDNLPSLQLPNIDYNFDTNKLIVTAAGGNIITIFAKLLHDLLLGTRTLVVFNQKILKEWNLSIYLQNWIDRCDGELRDIIKLMASQEYSDFDYNILPNKRYFFTYGNNIDMGNPNNNESSTNKSSTFEELENNFESAGHFQPAAGHFQPAAGHFQPAAGHFQPAAGQFQPAAGHFQPAAGHFQPAAGQFQPAAGHFLLLLVISNLLLVNFNRGGFIEVEQVIGI